MFRPALFNLEEVVVDSTIWHYSLAIPEDHEAPIALNLRSHLSVNSIREGRAGS